MCVFGRRAFSFDLDHKSEHEIQPMIFFSFTRSSVAIVVCDFFLKETCAIIIWPISCDLSCHSAELLADISLVTEDSRCQIELYGELLRSYDVSQ